MFKEPESSGRVWYSRRILVGSLSPPRLWNRTQLWVTVLFFLQQPRNDSLSTLSELGTKKVL